MNKWGVKMGLFWIASMFLLLAFCAISVVVAVKAKARCVRLEAEAYIMNNLDSKTVEVDVDYPFLPKEMSVYITLMSRELEIDPDLAVAILLKENPTIDKDAIHRNQNGTVDVGLWQLNDRYLYTQFEKDYWKMTDLELDAYNWKHNTYIALHHIKYLSESVKVMDEIIMAYNAGIGAVMNNRVPESTYQYLRHVKNNYSLLKNKA